MNSMNMDEDANTLTFEEFSEAIKTWGRVLVSHNDLSRRHSARRISLQPHQGSSSPRKPEMSPLATDNDDDDADAADANTASVNVDVDADADKKSSEKEMSPVVGSAGSIQGSGGKSGTSTQSDPLLKGSQKTYQTDSVPPVYENETLDETNDKQHLLNSMWRELEEEDDAEEEDLLLEMSNVHLLLTAMLQLLVGTVLVTIFSDPMVDVIDNFSTTINVSAFFVSFVVTPMASNASEIYSALVFAAKKSTEGISLGFSALYGAACMNNTFVLCIFCAIIYFRELEWTFLVETLVILLTILVVGAIGMNKTIEMWMAGVVLCMFPLSLLLVAVLEDALDD